MAHHFTPGTGFFVHTPSWHRLERKVLLEWPGSWQAAREEAELLWEPETVPVFEEPAYLAANPDADPAVAGYQRIVRSDNRMTLGVQSADYRVISNAEFGYVIESILGTEVDLATGESAEIKFEGVFELYQGRQVFAVVFLGNGIEVPGDNSLTFRYAVFYTRHDGQGGLRCLITNVRVVCANTAKASEMGAKEEETAFTIRHTANWDERVAEVRDKVAEALRANERYFELCAQMATKKVTPGVTTRMIRRFLPIGDDMGDRQRRNRENEREYLRALLAGPTIAEEHRRTPYGFLMAATEWSDHARPHRTDSSYVTRQLVSKEPLKVRAFTIAKQYAGIKG